MKVLVTGASGCIGRRLVPFLRGRGHDVVRGVRRVKGPADAHVDLDDERTLRPALAGVDVAVYLIHGLARGAGYPAWEAHGAAAFAEACRAQGVGRIVYLGGVLPTGTASVHLRARAATGEALRSTGVPVVELRAGMIVAADSASFVLARDLAARVPVAVRPPWQRARQRPIGVDDVLWAIEASFTAPAGIYACPGPDVVGGDEVLAILARLLGRHLSVRDVSWLDHRLVARVLPHLTDASADVVAELVAGMTADLLGGDEPDIFDHLPGHRREPFVVAARRALHERSSTTLSSTHAQLWERALRRLVGAPR